MHFSWEEEEEFYLVDATAPTDRWMSTDFVE